MMAIAVGLVFAFGAYLWARSDSSMATEEQAAVAQPTGSTSAGTPLAMGGLTEVVDGVETGVGTTVGAGADESSSGTTSGQPQDEADEITGDVAVVPPSDSKAVAKVKKKRDKKSSTPANTAKPSAPSSAERTLDPFNLRPGGKTPTAPSGSTDPLAPKRLSSADIKAGIEPIKAPAANCGVMHGASPGEKVSIKISVSGATGKVTKATPFAPHSGTALGRCVAAAAKKARFKEFKSITMGFQYAFRMY